MPNYFKASPSIKQLELIKMYTDMAKSGYKTIDNQKIDSAFNDMEVRAFKKYVLSVFEKHDIKSILDYGCGGSDYNKQGFHDNLSAKEYFHLEQISLYEPARNIDQRQPVDSVVCFDVLEHIFIADIPNLIRELFSLAKKTLIINVACYPARALLPNGENAHITVRPHMWWKGAFDQIAIEYPEISINLWCSTGWRKVTMFEEYKANDWLQSVNFTTNV
jgi:hypothetical protein